MKNRSLLDTPYALASGIHKQIIASLPFIIKNEKYVCLSEADRRTIRNTSMYANTPIIKLCRAIFDADKIDNFMLYDFSAFKGDIPEVLCMDDICIDGKFIDTSVMAPLQKAWLNLTPILGKRDTYNSTIIVNDFNAMSGMFVRGLLTMTYNDSQMWLNPALSVFVIESYSMTISNILSQLYNLDLVEKRFVQTLFATYYAQLLAGNEHDLKMPPLLARCRFLGSIADIHACLDRALPFRDNNGSDYLSIGKICNILSKVGPARMNAISPAKIYSILSASSVDSISMLIATDYPPYWVYQMMRVASGMKNPVLLNVIKKESNNMKKIQEFGEELTNPNILVDKLER